MCRVGHRIVVIVALLALLGGVRTAEAKYRYGQYVAGAGDAGFFVFGEGISTNPRNVDAVVATIEDVEDFGGGVNTLTPINPSWDNQLAGRLGLGYGWAGGSKIVFTVWGFSSDQSASGSGPAGGLTHFAIGPPIRTAGGYVGDQASPGSFAMTTEIEAGTGDLAFARTESVSESFTIDWSVGLRYARYEERSFGAYAEQQALGGTVYEADKSIESDMFGVRAALRGSYRFAGAFSVDAGIGLSFLDGEITGESGLTPTGSGTTPSSFVSIADDSRSGSMRDVELTVSWWAVGDAVRVWAGWEQQVWDGVPTDLVRNFPGTTAPLATRDSVTFSGYKLGVFVRF
jgi:hypothetical protein